MRTFEKKKRILELSDLGLNQVEISKETEIPRSTVRDILKKYCGGVTQLAEVSDSKSECCEFESHRRYHYLYLLGLYLGDGYIIKEPRCYKIRISFDAKYPDIIKKCEDSFLEIFPNNKSNRIQTGNKIDVYLYSKKLPFLFPQHGKGLKYKRKIVLDKWQKKLIDQEPEPFLVGLLHSDGGCDKNVVNGKSYRRYQFTNKSKDIINMFEMTARNIGLKFRVSGYQEKYTVAFSIRSDVEKLDKMGALKYENHIT